MLTLAQNSFSKEAISGVSRCHFSPSSGVASLVSSDASSWGSDITEPTSPHSLVSLDSPLESVSHEDHTPVPSPSHCYQKNWSYLNKNSDVYNWRQSSTWDGDEKMVAHVRKRHSSDPSCGKELFSVNEMPEKCRCALLTRERVDWGIYPFLNAYSWNDRCECRNLKRGKFKQLRITDYFKFQSKTSSKWIALYKSTQGTKKEDREPCPPKLELPMDTDDLSWLLRNASGRTNSLSSKCLVEKDSCFASSSPSRDLSLPDLINSVSGNTGGATELDLVNIEVEISDSFLVQKHEIKPVLKPVKNSSVQKRGVICRWEGCNENVSTKEALLDHIKLKHINGESEESYGNFTCQWAGCRVQGRSSKCRNWLERHVLFHVDCKPSCLKPFSCIVDGCGLRFGSQLMLQRHVNSHFNAQCVSNGTQCTKKNGDITPTKHVRKNSRKLRLRKRKSPGHDLDFFDDVAAQKITSIITRKKHKSQIVLIEDQSCELVGDSIKLKSEIICRRKSRREEEVLIRWSPDLFSEEWVSCHCVPKEKLVNLSRIPAVFRQKILIAAKPQSSSQNRKRPKLDDAPLT
ncbi:uncharacterized protein LOC136038658 isoform X2 [Artemia franciscana]|uniref:uncharacterized protein LOC136038658 isoform X2 n=1 Tax=Artemia franciscana TaxID=6661 RepID=UPI0032DB40D9